MSGTTPAESGKHQHPEFWGIHGVIEGLCSCDYNGELVDRVLLDDLDVADVIGSRCAGLRIRVTIETIEEP